MCDNYVSSRKRQSIHDNIFFAEFLSVKFYRFFERYSEFYTLLLFLVNMPGINFYELCVTELKLRTNSDQITYTYCYKYAIYCQGLRSSMSLTESPH